MTKAKPKKGSPKSPVAPKSNSAVTRWLDAVASGASTMSQRNVEALKRAGVTVAEVRRLSRARGVHVVQLTDDRGNVLLAASRHGFRIIS